MSSFVLSFLLILHISMSQSAAPLTTPSLYMTPLNLTSLIDRVLSVNDKTKPSLTHVLTEVEISRLLVKVRKVFLSQSVLLESIPPMQVCGDIRGQYSDLIRIFSKIGWPPEKNYLLLGDYVDHGRYQLEVIIILFAYKCMYSELFFMLRGNHECSRVNMKYGFFEEVKRRYSIRLFEKIQDVFNVMPLTVKRKYTYSATSQRPGVEPTIVLCRYCGEFDNSAASMNVSEELMCSFTIPKPGRPLRIRAPKTRNDGNGPSNGAAPRSINK